VDGLVFSHTLRVCGFSPMSTTSHPSPLPEDITAALRVVGVGKVELSVDEEALLRLLAGSVGVRSDQLMRDPVMSRVGIEERLSRLEAAGLLSRREMISREAAWVFLTRAGCRAIGVPYRRLDVRALDHRYYVNEVRLSVLASSPAGIWCPERFLPGRGSPRSKEWPDAVLTLGHRSYAIEVELSMKVDWRLRGLVVQKASRHDAVVYFCPARTFSRVSAVVAGLGLGNVHVRLLECEPPRPAVRFPRAKRGAPPLPGERAIAVWVSEQRMVRLDHLACLLGVAMPEAERRLAEFVEIGSLGRGPGLAGEEDWFWLRPRGERLAANGIGPVESGRFARYERMAVVNGLRLALESSKSGSRWVSREVWRAGDGRGVAWQHAPDGVVLGPDGSRMAVYVLLRLNRNQKVPGLLRRFSASFDRVLCVGPPRVRMALAEMARRGGLANVEFADVKGKRAVAAPPPSRGRMRGPLPERTAVPADVRRAVRLCGEEGYLSLAELVSLTGCSDSGGVEALQVAEALGMVRDDWRDALGRQVFAATDRGLRFAELPLRAVQGWQVSKTVGIREVVVAARAELAGPSSGVCWVSGRMLGGAVGRGPRRLKALVAEGERTRAVEVMGTHVERTAARLRWVLGVCDCAVLYCSPSVWEAAEKLVAKRGWDKVELRAVSASVEADRETFRKLGTGF
jgi:hypothetical protein